MVDKKRVNKKNEDENIDVNRYRNRSCNGGFFTYQAINIESSYVNSVEVNRYIYLLKDIKPTKIYYIGETLKGKLSKKQEELAEFVHIENDHSFVKDDNYVISFLVFNRVDFNSEKGKEYYESLKGLDDIGIQFAFYKCKNEEAFFSYFNYEQYGIEMTRNFFYAIRSTANDKFFNIREVGFPVSPNSYAKNDILLGECIEAKN